MFNFYNWLYYKLFGESNIKLSDNIIKIKQEIFPILLKNIPLCDDITLEREYLQILKSLNRVPTYSEMIYLLRYKKFVDNDLVYSMCDSHEIDQTEQLLLHLITNNIHGCIVETGVWRGGMGMYMKAILNEYKDNRDIYLFDTYKYFPPPNNNNIKDNDIHSIVELLFQNMQSVEQVKQNFERFNLLDNHVFFVAGLFSETIPYTDVGDIAILRLDSDYYESTMFVLEHYYKNIVPGGFLIIDDYNNHYLGCKDAIHDFRKKYNITNKIVDDKIGSVYWQK